MAELELPPPRYSRFRIFSISDALIIDVLVSYIYLLLPGPLSPSLALLSLLIVLRVASAPLAPPSLFVGVLTSGVDEASPCVQ
jgi:hypothetical protein